MAAPRLSEAQKQDLIRRFQDGENTQELAGSFGCSANTVTRVVKAALDPAAYETLKRTRSRRPGAVAGSSAATEPVAPSAALSADSPEMAPEPLTTPSAACVAASADDSAATAGAPPPAAVSETEMKVDPQQREPQQVDPQVDDESEESPEGQRSGHGSSLELAIDDAADFGSADDDLGDEDGGEEDGFDVSSDGIPADMSAHSFVEVPIDAAALLNQPLVTAQPFQGAEIPDSAYMLVDKTVELQAVPLAEVPDLGRLAPEEMALQALVLYTNPRHAKRLCGRSQRVIKLPDTRVLQRTASYLVRQGIQRVVIEGSLYSLLEG